MLQQRSYQNANVIPIVRSQHRTTNDIIPSFVASILGAIQLFLWIGIIALEIISIYYDAGRGTIYAGIWCSFIFFITWVSMYCYLCCSKSRGCGIYLVIQNIINLVFAIILLIFTYRFIQEPCLCYGVLCFIPNWDYFYDNDFNHYNRYVCNVRTIRKLPVLKGLLACAAIILVCNIIFIIVYCIALIRLRAKTRPKSHQPNVVYQRQSEAVQMNRQPSYRSSIMNYSPHQHQQLYPFQYTQTPSQWASAPLPDEMYQHKF